MMSDETSAGRGLFDGFEANRTPSADDYRAALTSGMIVFDTNVLLNLYRLKPDSRDHLLDVMSHLRDLLWIPHQVVTEFWARRRDVLQDPRGTAAARDQLARLRNQTDQAIRAWANLISLGNEAAVDLRDSVLDGFDHAIELIAEWEDSEIGRYRRDTGSDPVLQKLEEILAGRVGAPLSATEYQEALVEGRRRVEACIPPGYKDARKRGDGAVGDYLIWHQALREAATRRCPVVFVTADVKEDWWHLEQRIPVGPRAELVQEMLDARCSLIMLRPRELLRWATELLRVNIPASAVEDVGRVQKLQQEQSEEPDEDGLEELEEYETAWTTATVAVVMSRLDHEAPALADTIRLAAEGGGFVGREKIYEIAGFGQKRSLRGFVKPVQRIVAEFQSKGLVPQPAEDLISTVRDDQTGLLAGFEVPAAVVPLIRRRSVSQPES